MPRRTLHNGDFQRMATKFNKYGVSELTRLEIQNTENNQKKTQLIQVSSSKSNSANFDLRTGHFEQPKILQTTTVYFLSFIESGTLHCLGPIGFKTLDLWPPLYLCNLFTGSTTSSIYMRPLLYLCKIFIGYATSSMDLYPLLCSTKYLLHNLAH